MSWPPQSGVVQRGRTRASGVRSWGFEPSLPNTAVSSRTMPDVIIAPYMQNWPIVVNDAPIRCHRCDGPIIGTGEGTVRLLLEAVARHAEECPNAHDYQPQAHLLGE